MRDGAALASMRLTRVYGHALSAVYDSNYCRGGAEGEAGLPRRSRPLPSAPADEALEILLCNSNHIRDTDVPQLSLRAQPVDGVRTHVQPRRGFSDRQERCCCGLEGPETAAWRSLDQGWTKCLGKTCERA
jgi:hypothetical protein